MSETAPTSAPEAPKSADHAELAKAEAKAARLKFEVEQNTLFGKYDKVEGPLAEDGRPIAGSHHDYHAQRPSDGILRDGAEFRKDGKYASSADYYAQNGTSTTDANGNVFHEGDEASAARYYDELIGGNEKNEVYEGLDYESMSMHQLALRAAEATQLGDIAEVADIKETLNVRLLNEAITAGTDEAETEYLEKMEQYDNLVKLAVKRLEDKSKTPEAPGADDDETEGDEKGEKDPGTDKDETDKDKNEAGKDESDKDKAEKDKPAAKEHEVGDELLFNGEGVKVLSVFKSEDGEVLYKVEHANGKVVVAQPEELYGFFEKKPKAEKPEKAEKADKEALGEKIKGFWGKSKNFIFEKFTEGYMSAKWHLENDVLTRGIPAGMDFMESDNIKNKRRIMLVAGAAGVLLAHAIFKDVNVFAHMPDIDLFNGGHLGGGSAEGGETPDTTPTPEATEAAHTPEEQAVIDSMNPDNIVPNDEAINPKLMHPEYLGTDLDPSTPDSDVDVQLPTVDVAPDPASYVADGEGGIALLEQLGIDPAKWASNAERFLTEHPEDFYRMDDGGIGLSHEGWLSTATQNDLNSLK